MPEEVRAEMVSTVLAVEVAVGEHVRVDQTLVLLESMKMEIPVEAPRAGKVREIKVSEGQTVQEGDTVAVID